ncbi:MAG: DUF2339 domain-containing protein, partial [Verrucomicrobiaceae bacterium]
AQQASAQQGDGARLRDFFSADAEQEVRAVVHAFRGREADATSEALERALSRIEELENQIRDGKIPVVPTGRRTSESGLVQSTGPAQEVVQHPTRNSERDGDAGEKPATPPPLPAQAIWEKHIDQDEAASSTLEPLPTEPKEPFSLEKFMGVKLFAWLGGVAMFFGVIFFVKYAFENNLISPSARITLGFVAGAALLTGGLITHRLAKYRVLAQAFCATGVLILYGVSFAAHAIYHFPAFGTVQTFGLMACITVVAFLTAVKLDALVVAVLGMLGGFMTPVLLSTGQDQVLALFGYIALLDAGLLAVSRHRRWDFLTPCAAAGTALMQIGWFAKFFNVGSYELGSRTLIPMGILLGFIALFLFGGWIRRRRPSLYASGSVIGLAGMAILFAFVMLLHASVAERYLLLHGFLLLVHLGVIAAVMARPALGAAQLVTALLAFLHLGCWTLSYLTPENLNVTLATYLVFGAVHAVVPVVLSRRVPARVGEASLRSAPWFAPLALGMMFLPILSLNPVPMSLWAAALIANLLVIGMAVKTRALLPVMASLAITMAMAGAWLIKGPSNTGSLLPFLAVVSGFSILFTLSGRWLVGDRPAEEGEELSAATTLPLVATVLPFILLLLAIGQLPIP